MTRAAAYHHGDLRATLVRTATDLARADGPEGVVLREAARRVGVSHNAAYRHFADRDELLAAVAVTGHGELAARMRAAQGAATASRRLDAQGRARARLRALGQTYVEFALEQPGLFRVCFHGLVKEGPEGAEPFLLLGEAIDDLVATGVIDPRDRQGAELMCWSAVHGFSLLVLDGPLRSFPAADHRTALTAMLDAIDHRL